MSRSTLFALLLVLLLVTFIVAADTASPSSAEIIVQTEKQQPNNVNNVNNNTPPAVESNKQTQAVKEETITVEDGKKEEKQPQETAAASSDSAHKQEKQEVAKESSREGLVDAWLERPFSLLNAINNQLERNARMFRRSLWEDEFEDAFDEDDMYDHFFGGNSLFDSVFNTRRRIPSLFDSLRRRRASNNLYRRPAFYLNRLFRDHGEQESHKKHDGSCGCGNKQQEAAVEPVKQQDASTDMKAKQESVTVPVLKRVKSEWNEDKDSYKIKLNIPEGVYTKDKIKIQVKPYFNDKEIIIISGENKEKQSSFEKSFVFQKAIDSDKVKAKFENTVLSIEVAKKPHVDNVKQIAIE